MDGLQGTAEPVPADALVEGEPAAVEPTGGDRGAFVRDRAHRLGTASITHQGLVAPSDDAEVAAWWA